MANSKVALFSTYYLQSSQTFIYHEINSVKAFDIDVFTRRMMNMDRFPFERVYMPATEKGFINKIKNLVYATVCYSKRFIELFEENHYDLVHAQFGPAGIYAMYYAKKFNLPLVVTFCGYDVPLLQTKRRFLPEFWRYWLLSSSMLKRCTLVFAVSQDLADRLEQLGVPKDKIRVFHRGIQIPEVKSYNRASDAPLRVIMAGRFTEKKGFEYGIEAVALARDAGCKIKLEIIGKGDLRSQCENLVKKLDLQNEVSFVDELKQTELFNHYLESDIVMVPSVTAKNGDVEGITNVLKEGAARGLLSLVTRHGGNPDAVVDDETGYIVPERDSRALADKLIEIWHHPERLEEMGRKGAKKIRNEFNIEETGKILDSLYAEAISRFKSQK